mgnify:FL=1
MHDGEVTPVLVGRAIPPLEAMLVVLPETVELRFRPAGILVLQEGETCTLTFPRATFLAMLAAEVAAERAAAEGKHG